MALPFLAACPHSTSAPTVVVSTLAGNGTAGWADGPGQEAEFQDPYALAIDSQGAIWVADGNNRIRKVSPDGNTVTVAGDGIAGWKDGPALMAEFDEPAGVAVDQAGDCYVGDAKNNRIRKIAADSTVTTLAGNGMAGFEDGTGGPTGTAEFSIPANVLLDGKGNLYVSDSFNGSVRVVSTSDGTTTTLAGNGLWGYRDGTGGRFGTAQFHLNGGLAFAKGGNLVVVDTLNQRLRSVAPSGNTTTFAGNGYAGLVNGPLLKSEFSDPDGIAIASDGSIFVSDTANNCIRALTPGGGSTTLAGGSKGFADGPAGTAQFDYPGDLAIDPQGNLYVADGSNRIRKITFGH